LGQLPPSPTLSSSGLPAPGTPYSQLPSPNDPNLVEAAAQQITTSSLNNYGALPNPEAAYESLITQSVPSLVGAIQSQDPQYQQALSSLPAGSAAQPQTPAAVPSDLVTPPPTYAFNQKQYLQWSQQQLQQPANSSWKSMGQMPMLSMGYINWAQGNNNAKFVKQWQTTLKKQQFYSGPTNGIWDENTKAAFDSMMASQAIPVALYSQNSTQQAGAASMLGALGYDMQTLQTDAYHDPVMQHQMVVNWMMAQGPDQKFGDKSELDNFVSQFGSQNLPASWQSVYSAANNPLDFIAQGISNIPIIGAIGNLASNNEIPNALRVQSTNLTAQLKASEAQQAKTENLTSAQLKALTAGDQQALANLTSQVQNGMGFMGSVNSYDTARTNALLSMHFMFADAASIIGGPFQGIANALTVGAGGTNLSPEAQKILGKSKNLNLNPFDPNGIVGQQVAASDGNISQGLFGQDWMTKNPLLATITNTAINMADDPISYIPGAAYEKVGTALNSGSRAIMSMSKGLQDIGEAVTDSGPLRIATNPEVAQTILSIKASPKFMGVTTVRDIIGGTSMGETGATQLAAIKDLLANPNATDQDWSNLLTEQGFNHRIASLSGATERAGYLSHLGNVFNQTRTGFRASLARMGMADHLGQFDFSSNLGVGLSQMQDWATLAKLDPSVTRDLLDGMVGIPEAEKIVAFGKYKDAVVQGIDTLARAQGRTAEEVFNAITKRRRSLFGSFGAGSGDMVSGFMADPKLGAELSWTDLHGEDEVVNRLNQSIKDAQDAIVMKSQMLDSHASALETAGMEGGDDTESALAEDREQVNMRKQDLAKLIDQRDAYQKLAPAARRPSPAIAEQLRDNYSFPFSMNELATELNPALKAWDKAQHATGMNVMTQLWKPWILANMGTAMRIVIGEDLIRPSWKLLFDGHPLVAAKLMGEGIGKAIVSGFIPDKVSIPFTKSLGTSQVVDDTGNAIEGATVGADGKALDADGNPLPGAKVQKQNIHPGRDLRAGIEKNVAKMGTADLVHGIMSKWMSAMDPEVFIKYAAGDINYDQALGFMINKWSNSSMIRPYLDHLAGEGATEESARQVLADTISKSTEPGVAEIRRIHPNVDAHAALLHEFLKAHMQMPELRQMWLDGGADTQKISELAKNHAHDATEPMPVIFAPRNTLTAQHWLMKAVNKYPQWMFDKKLSPMIAAARDTGFMALRKQFIGDLGDFYKGQANWTQDKIEDEATSLAYEWSQRNMYMGQRTMLGSSLRNVFPFWGATANMARFYLREGLSHPFSADATLRLVKWSEDQQQNNQQYATGANGFLSMMGFTGGDALSIDPFHSFFLTSDGVDSFVPGTGPWMNLITSFAPGHQAVAEALANTPLSSELGLDSTTGQAAPIIPWLGQMLSGAADTGAAAVGDTSPVNLGPLGESTDYQNEQEDELIRQREEQGQTVTPADESSILSEVGRKFLLEGALRWATPVTPSIVNQPGQALTNAMSAYNAMTTTEEKDNLIAAEIGVSPEAYQTAIANQTVHELVAKASMPAIAMAYFDQNVSPEERDIIGGQHPWVTAYSTSFYDRPIDPETGQPQQGPESTFNNEVNTGNITLDNANNYIAKIQNATQIQQGWNAVDQLNNAKYAFMRQNGLTTQSSLYKQWDQEVYQPSLTAIDANNLAWSKAFGSASGSGTTLSDEAERTAPLRTLMSLEVIPQDPAFETTSTTLWRQALVWRDQASQQIAALQMGTHSTAEIDLVMQGLQTRLAWLAQQDPTFATQLDSYSFGQWESVVTMESDEIRNEQLYGIAT
jgi:hypothetical protein